MIRFIVETYTSKRDVNGNCYHFNVVTSTKTGNLLYVRDAGGPDNVRIRLRSVLKDDEHVHSGPAHVLPKMEWRRRARFVEGSEYAHYEHELTDKAILALEEEE